MHFCVLIPRLVDLLLNTKVTIQPAWLTENRLRFITITTLIGLYYISTLVGYMDCELLWHRQY